jgi:uncharacterized damage-inducible protein DinB
VDVNIDALLNDIFGRVRDLVPGIVDGLSEQQLAVRPIDAGNSIGWLVWHLTRVQDDHLAGAAGTEQVWLRDGWNRRFGLGLEDRDIGYGHDDAQVLAVRASAELLSGYHAAVAEETERFLSGLTESDLDRVVDERWDPPVTLGVRIVSVASDTLQHAGQAAYVRGLLGF